MLATFVVTLAAAMALALLARRGQHKADPRAFFAAHGQFGAVLFFMLSVGETYSIGSVLGFPGGVVASGSGLALWFIGYILLAFPVGFVLYPLLWESGRAAGAITLPDLFRTHFRSQTMERIVAGILILLMLPLGTMQFIGLSSVLGALDLGLPTPALGFFAAILAFTFVAVAGLRAAALISILKDALMLGAILLVATLALSHWNYHPTRTMAEALRHTGAPSLRVDLFAISTILVQSLGFCIAPQTAAATFSARNVASIRRAQTWMPLYMVLFPLLFAIAGYALTHKLDASRPDATFLAVAASLLPGWALGLVLGGVALTALVWLGSVCLSLAAIVTRNIVPDLKPHHQKRTGLIVIAVYLALSVLSASFHTVLIANLNTLFYLGLVQLVPGIVTIVYGHHRRIGITLLGMFGGFAVALALRDSEINLYGVNPALIGLVCNAAFLKAFNK